MRFDSGCLAAGDQACQQAAGIALARLARFRRELYWCLWRRPDALFELADAALTAGQAVSLPYLSLEPAFRRGHGMICQALAGGGIDEEALRDLLVAVRPADWPLVFAVGAPVYPRPEAATSPGREWHHHSCQGGHGSDEPVAAGRALQWLARLSCTPGSRPAPQDQVRAGVRDDATRQAAQQVTAHAARLRAAGETPIPLSVHDAGSGEAPLTWDLRDHRDRVQILVRVRNDRVMYPDPAPEPPRRGRPRKHSAGRFEGKNPATWGPPGQELALHDDRYGQVSVMSWGGLHPRLYCRGRFGGFRASPVIGCHLIRVTVTGLPDGRKVPGPLWPWRAGPGMPDLDLIGRAYLHRFDTGHTYRFAGHALGWDKAALRHPGQAARWTWLIIAAITRLRLARPLAEDHRQRRERRRKQGKLSPGRVRRDFARLAAPAPPRPATTSSRRPPDITQRVKTQALCGRIPDMEASPRQLAGMEAGQAGIDGVVTSRRAPRAPSAWRGDLTEARASIRTDDNKARFIDNRL